MAHPPPADSALQRRLFIGSAPREPRIMKNCHDQFGLLILASFPKHLEDNSWTQDLRNTQDTSWRRSKHIFLRRGSPSLWRVLFLQRKNRAKPETRTRAEMTSPEKGWGIQKRNEKSKPEPSGKSLRHGLARVGKIWNSEIRVPGLRRPKSSGEPNGPSRMISLWRQRLVFYPLFLEISTYVLYPPEKLKGFDIHGLEANWLIRSQIESNILDVSRL